MASRDPTLAAASNNRYTPVSLRDRIGALDALRGWALLMILIANMPAYGSPVYYLADAGEQWWTSHTDHIAETLVQTVVHNESVALFSFLFGLGFAMQFLRAGSAVGSFLAPYLRRLLALIAIGAIHTYLIWMGDILILYGILGFFLLLFRSAKPAVILSLAIVLYLLPPARWELSVIRQVSGSRASPATMGSPAGALTVQEEARKQVESSVHAYAHGSWVEITRQRARDYAYYAAHNQAMTVFPMFLFGLYAGRRKLFQDIESRLDCFRRALVRSAAVALPGIVLLRALYLPMAPSWAALFRPVVFAVEHAALIVFYISAITLIQQHGRLKWLIGSLEAAGRMSLSNYIFQSVACTLLFYSYGLGLYGRVGPALGVVMALGLFALQAWLSVLWSRRFRLGPLEWVWRAVTYGRAPAMR